MKYDKINYIKYGVVSLSLILLMLFMFLNRDKINERNGNLINLDSKVDYKISDDDKETIINDVNSIIEKDLNSFYVYFDKSYENINDMHNQDKLWMAYWYLKDDKNLKYITDYTSDEILNKMQNIFGSKFNLIFEDIKDYNGNSIYVFNKSSNVYKYNGYGSAASSLNLVRNDFVDFEYKDNKYFITYDSLFYYIYGVLDLGKIDIVDIKYNKLTTYDLNSYEDEIMVTDEIYNKIKDDITKITYVFEKENDKLILTGIKLSSK